MRKASMIAFFTFLGCGVFGFIAGIAIGLIDPRLLEHNSVVSSFFTIVGIGGFVTAVIFDQKAERIKKECLARYKIGTGY
jgi:hypothetical protein